MSNQRKKTGFWLLPQLYLKSSNHIMSIIANKCNDKENTILVRRTGRQRSLDLWGLSRMGYNLICRHDLNLSTKS